MVDHSENHQPAQPDLTDEKQSRFSIRSVSWRRLFAYLKPYRGRMVLAILALLLSTGFGLAFPAVIVRLLDTVTQSPQFGPLNRLAGPVDRNLSAPGRF